jgi:protein-tyrosine phosphatase
MGVSTSAEVELGQHLQNDSSYEGGPSFLWELFYVLALIIARDEPDSLETERESSEPNHQDDLPTISDVTIPSAQFVVLERRFTYSDSLLFDWRSYLESKPSTLGMYQSLFPKVEKEWSQITEIEPDIFLGGIPIPVDDCLGLQSINSSQAPHVLLSEFGIKTIVSFSDREILWNYGENISFIHFVVPDYPHLFISECFEPAIEKIDDARRRGDKIFIHCHMGISRSTTVLIAYYLARGIPDNPTPSLTDIIRFVQTKRPFIRPNIGFFAQLLELETALNTLRSSQGL